MWRGENEGRGEMEGVGTSICLATPPKCTEKEEEKRREGGEGKEEAKSRK